jgi:hypothetical protein
LGFDLDRGFAGSVCTKVHNPAHEGTKRHFVHFMLATRVNACEATTNCTPPEAVLFAALLNNLPYVFATASQPLILS